MDSLDKAGDFPFDIYVGTANFGQAYGNVKEFDGLHKNELNGILDFMEGPYQFHLDTAPGYGNSEEVIGLFGKNRSILNRVTTKISPSSYSTSKSILESIRRSSDLMGVGQFENILLHGFNEIELQHKSTITEGLSRLIEEDLTRHVGLSCYTEAEVLLAKEHFPLLSVFQVPENVVDGRLINSRAITNLHELGNRFIVRSIFLQGKLLERESSLSFLNSYIVNLQQSALINNLSVFEYCIAYVKSIPWLSGIVIGVDSVKQIEQFIIAIEKEYVGVDFCNQTIDAHLVDPRNWKSN
jgi:aryl-alcohol dehydrogenase-like predicted oxidoreductase